MKEIGNILDNHIILNTDEKILESTEGNNMKILHWFEWGTFKKIKKRQKKA